MSLSSLIVLEKKNVHLEILSSLGLHKHTFGTMHACLCNFNKLGCGVIDLSMFSMEFGFIFSKYLDNRSWCKLAYTCNSKM
jgi:hypothetical protein